MLRVLTHPISRCCQKISSKPLSFYRSSLLGLAATLIIPASALSQAEIDFGLATARTSERLLLDANSLTFNIDEDIVTVSGDVQIFFKGASLEADEVVYDRPSRTLKAIGNVRLIDTDGYVVRSQEITLDDDFRTGFFNALQLESPDETFFAASSGERSEDEKTLLRRSTYNVCAACRTDPGRVPTWRIKSEEIIIDDVKQRVRYRNASFELLGIPVAYLPIFSHVDPRVKQKSGFLRPEFVQNSELGIGVGLPYYYAISDSSDITITPTILSDQGLLGEIEWRKRTRRGAYTLHLAGIDQQEPGNFSGQSGETDLRGGLRTQGRFAISRQWDAGWNILALSDRTFSDDYSLLTNRPDSFTSNVNVTGLGEKNFFDARGLFFNVLDEDTPTSGNLQAQQAIVHPVIDYDGVLDRPIIGGQLAFRSNVTTLSRADEDVEFINGTGFLNGASGVVGRVSSEFEWQRRFIASGGHVITPVLAARGDAQAFNQDETALSSIAASDEILRGQVTAGLEWRYPILLLHGKSSHVFEPIAQIYASPNEQQIDRFLNEDAQTFTLDDTNIFARDRFRGFDRVEGGIRTNLGFTHKTNWTEWLKTDLLVGQSFHISGRNSFAEQGLANLQSQNGLQDDRSDLVARISATAYRRTQLTGRIRVDNDYNEINQAEVLASFKSTFVDVSGRYTFFAEEPEDLLPQTAEAAGTLAIRPHKNWTIFGGLLYDFDEEQFVRNNIGVSFDDRQLRLTFGFLQSFDSFGGLNEESFQFGINFRTLGGIDVGNVGSTFR